MKKGFTLIEMAIVLLIIGVLMAATMRFGSFRIAELKSQSLKENFVGRYTTLYSQNMASSFRDGKKYRQLSLVFGTGITVIVDTIPSPIDPIFSDIEIRNLSLNEDPDSFIDSAMIIWKPYILGCDISDTQSHSGSMLSFQLFVPANGKEYCFEIPSETCKLIETHCRD